MFLYDSPALHPCIGHPLTTAHNVIIPAAYTLLTMRPTGRSPEHLYTNKTSPWTTEERGQSRLKPSAWGQLHETQ